MTGTARLGILMFDHRGVERACSGGSFEEFAGVLIHHHHCRVLADNILLQCLLVGIGYLAMGFLRHGVDTGLSTLIRTTFSRTELPCIQ